MATLWRQVVRKLPTTSKSRYMEEKSVERIIRFLLDCLSSANNVCLNVYSNVYGWFISMVCRTITNFGKFIKNKGTRQKIGTLSLW